MKRLKFPARATNLLTRPKPPVPAAPLAARPAPTPEAIRTRAYFLWQTAGCPAGDGVGFWVAAEREMTS